MIIQVCLIFVVSSGYVHAQAVAEGGKTLDALLKEALPGSNGNSVGSGGTTENIDLAIGEVFTRPTSAPGIQTNVGSQGTGGIPGTGSCTCVPYYLCSNGTINTNGEGIIDIRINEGPCDSYIEVCCDKADQVSEPITPTPPPQKHTGCGYRHPEGIGFRITGDKEHEAQFGEFPWMVAILREENIEGNPNKLNVYQCGGALVHPQVVVTAAHCVTAKKTFKIRAGEWDTQHTQEIFPHQDREVQSVTIHPQYYKGALYNDIAVLFLKSPVEIAENVDVICLPPQGTVTSDGTECFATGWGKDTFGKQGKYQVILKKIDLPVVNRNDCQESLRKTRLGKFFELHSSFICAGGEPGKDTCKGDGGSPLVCPIGGRGDRFYQAGIVAWGIGCGETGTPGVYVNVALFRDWIDQQMKLLNLDTSNYVY